MSVYRLHCFVGKGISMGDKLTYLTWTEDKAKEIEKNFKDSFDVLGWAFREYGNEIVYACSFGIEGIVLIDLISKVKKDARVIFLDTHLHFKETYDLIEKVKKRYPALNIKIIEPVLTLEEQANKFGERLWEREPNECCHIRKVQPLAEALIEIPAWISGIRREQSEARRNTNYINKDVKFQSIKICPLIDWTLDEIWTYVKLHELDYNELHDRGFPSIGCEMCTLPATDPTDERSGRWVQFEKTECGLHSF